MFSTPTLPLAPFELARKRIRAAAVAAYISAGLSTTLGIAASIGQKSVEPLWLLPDALLVVALAFGASKASRVCAALLVVYWAVARWLMWSEELPGFLAVVIASGFWIVFIGGLVGAIGFHRHKPAAKPDETAVSADALE